MINPPFVCFGCHGTLLKGSEVPACVEFVYNFPCFYAPYVGLSVSAALGSVTEEAEWEGGQRLKPTSNLLLDIQGKISLVVLMRANKYGIAMRRSAEVQKHKNTGNCTWG